MFIVCSIVLILCRLQHHDVSPAVTLDYDKIKYDLVCGEERKQAILLQALRWVSR